MSYVTIEQFGGLNLRDDPATVGAQQALNLLNVEFDRPGIVRTRGGYSDFITGTVITNFTPVYLTTGVTQIIAATAAGFTAYDSAGTSIASSAIAPQNVGSFARVGDPTNEYVFAANGNTGATSLRRWDGSAWSTPAVAYKPRIVASWSADSRLVMQSTESYSRIRFSNAGAPETFNADDYVDLSPGDGEAIVAVVEFNNNLFVFKQTKFFVFYGTSEDATGSPIFNYRTIPAGVGAVGYLAVCVAPDGVYFVDRTGVYKTGGADPIRVSSELDPFFTGATQDAYTGPSLYKSLLAGAGVDWVLNRLYLTVPTGASARHTFVLDLRTGIWTLWDVTAYSMSTLIDTTGISVPIFNGASGVSKMLPTDTTDDGTAISWLYQSGQYDLGAPFQEKRVRNSMVSGTGTVTFFRMRDYETSDLNAGVLVLGASSVATTLHAKSWRGTLMSHGFTGSGVMSVSSVAHYVSQVRPAGVRSPL